MAILNDIKNSIRDKLTADIPCLSLVKRYNDEINRLIAGEATTYQLPACFIEFMPREYAGGGFQNDYANEMIIKIHGVVMQKDESNDFDDTYQLMDDVYKSLAFFAVCYGNNAGGFNELQKVAESEILNLKGVGSFSIDFKCL